MRSPMPTIGWMVVVALLAACGAAPEARAGERKSHTPQIRVVGQAEVAAAPDRVSLDVAVVTRAATASRAASDNAEATSRVLAQLKTAFPKAAQISTRGYSLGAEYDYDKREGSRTPVGYLARNSIHVSLDDVTRAGALIDAAVAAGANEVQSVQFSVADPMPYRNRALAAAAVDARAKAAVLAEGLGLKVGRTIRVEETGSGHPRPQMAMFAEHAKASTPMEPGDVFFDASVSLWVELVGQAGQ